MQKKVRLLPGFRTRHISVESDPQEDLKNQIINNASDTRNKKNCALEPKIFVV